MKLSILSLIFVFLTACSSHEHMNHHEGVQKTEDKAERAKARADKAYDELDREMEK